VVLLAPHVPLRSAGGEWTTLAPVACLPSLLDVSSLSGRQTQKYFYFHFH